MTADDSLKLGWSSKGFSKGVGYAALSPSSAKLFREDPQKYFLRKVKKIDEPMSIPLVLGIAVHDGMEAYLGEGQEHEHALSKATSAAFGAIDRLYEDIEDPTVRENLDDLANPRNRTEIELSKQDLKRRAEDILVDATGFIYDYQDTFLAAKAQSPGCVRETEASVGRLAEKADRPTTIIESYDPHAGEYGEMPAAVIAGVPVRGRVDLVSELPGRRMMILDHKAVSKAIPYYPPYNDSGEWTSYEPSYDPATDLQLDMYAFASGIPRAGFNFMMRRPQYRPPHKPLHKDWVDERDWAEYPELMPAGFDHADEGIYQIVVWRPQPEDPPGFRPHEFTLSSIQPRVEQKVRQTAQALTESLLLYENGADPEIAFPAGDPKEIGKKACPYCYFNDEGLCPAPRDVSSKAAERQSTAAYREAIAKREELCESTPEIKSRREEWARAGHPTTFLRPDTDGS